MENADKIKEEIKPEEINKKERNKTLIVMIIIILIIFLASLVGAFLLGKQYANDETKEPEQQEQQNQQEEQVIPTTPKTIDIYRNSNGIECKKGEKDCKLIAAIPIKEKNAQIITISEELDEEYNYHPRLVLYKDQTLKIYNINKKTVLDIKLEDKYSSYDIQPAYDYSEALGIAVYNEDADYNKTDIAYYDIKEEKLLFENKYDDITILKGDYIQVSIDENENMDDFDDGKYKVNLLNLKTQKEVIKSKGACTYFSIETIDNRIIIYNVSGCIGSDSISVYNDKYTKLLNVVSSNEWEITSDNKIRYIKGNRAVTIDLDGKVLSQSKQYKKILHLIDGHILYHDDKNLYLTDEKKLNVKLSEWKKGYYYHYPISGYFDQEFFEDYETEKKEGYYFVVEYDDEYATGVELYFNPKTNEIKRYEVEEVGGYAKPVLYLYPQEKTNVTINFEKEDNLTTTYPKFKEEWKVTACPNGNLYDKEGKYYYGLYWEESSNHKVDFTEGFYVSKDNAIEFLEEKLSIIGLNDKERNEFIMYWLPILEKNEHNLVYFELTEERENFNKIEISPKPDSLLRVAIHVKKINKKQTIKEQELKPFKRTGFVAVEWGGIAYK